MLIMHEQLLDLCISRWSPNLLVLLQQVLFRFSCISSSLCELHGWLHKLSQWLSDLHILHGEFRLDCQLSLRSLLSTLPNLL